MPRHAIDAGIIDFILPPEKIAGKLKELQQSFSSADPGQKQSVVDKLNEGGFKQILTLLRMRVDVDFNFYKQTTIRRRIARRMLMLKLKNIQEYLRYLKNNMAKVDLLFQDLLIQVTFVFPRSNQKHFKKENDLELRIMVDSSVGFSVDLDE